MRKDKQKAEELRRAGKSYKAIRRELGIPISTQSDWFRNTSWSTEIRDRLFRETSWTNLDRLRLMVAATKKKFALLHEQYRQEAISQFPKLKKDPFFIAGIMLYWGEGDKNVNNSAIKLCNSDMGMIRFFYIFLRKILNAPTEKIKFNLLLYPDLVDTVQKNTWSKTTGIPLANFRKSIFITGRHPTRRLSHGVGNLYLGGRKHKEKLLKWIELYMHEVNSQVIA